jgi:xeroderma pigmentosum group C-complementing protein
VPDVYQEMLEETDEQQQVPRRPRRGTTASAAVATEPVSEPPLKRKRPGEGRAQRIALREAERQARETARMLESVPDDVEEDVEFEDVALPAPVIQTLSGDSEDEEEDGLFEDVDLGNILSDSLPHDEQMQQKELELNLTAQTASTPRRSVDRRKALTRIERIRRLEIHKMHVLCLMAHAARRNHWCNDEVVQDSVRSLLSDKMVDFLNPSSKLSQFGKTESLKRGVEMAAKMFRIRFAITERGLRRALWAADEDDLANRQLPPDLDSSYDRDDFQKAAKRLSGSRDTGAQLFCALLRAAGVETRLICSLQPLSFLPGGPTMLRPKTPETQSKPSRAERYQAAMAKYEQSNQASSATNGAVPSPRRRLGHPNATTYIPPSHVFTPAQPTSTEGVASEMKRPIHDESQYPVYWVEVLDVAHQKWQPVDPLVTETQWKPRALEPPASDRENNMCYVMAFEADGSAKDVTKRYAKAYNSKTRRMRVDGAVQDIMAETEAAASTDAADNASARPLSGARWLRRVMRYYEKRWQTDVDQIEDNELAALESREPMPRNVADFKDHPIFALVRHLRRHEVLVPGAHVAGTVGAGQKGPLERIYRRRDVRVARSREKWYRLGREIVPGEEPVKVLEKKVARRRGWANSGHDEEQDHQDGDEGDDDLFGANAITGTPIYTFEQTSPYIPPPIVGGRIPKNKFGNLDVYVPSMVPLGATHVKLERAAEAAHILNIDYAPALTGFSFKGRQGTAVLRGVVILKEHEAAVRAVVSGLQDLEAEMAEEMRTRVVLKMWRLLLRGLRIRDRIWARANDEPADDEIVEKISIEDVIGEEKATPGRRGKWRSRKVVSDAENEDGLPADDVSPGHGLDDDDDLGGGFIVD